MRKERLPDAVGFFKALSDPVRLRIVRLLLERPLCVCELTFILKMEQSRISHHLQILRGGGLVEDERRGRWMMYRIAPAGREALRAALQPALSGDRDHFRAHRRDLAELDIAVQDDIRGKRCGPPEAAPPKRKTR
ncbi:MAG: metalloregulator ArsR/SmtB family transcription factor [Candidatus Aminicenantales bacterium]